MSGIYIPGMEMPKNCAICGVRPEAKCPVNYRWLLQNPEYYDKRKPDCTLVEVPDHGRLIDADALLLKLLTAESGKVYDYCYPCKEVLQAIKDSPTIIPAEKEDIFYPNECEKMESEDE